MASTIGSLVVQLEARSERFERELAKARTTVRRMQAEIARLGGSTAGIEQQMVGGFARIASSMRGLDALAMRARTGFVALSGAIASLGIANFVRQSTQMADAIGDMAQQTSVSVEGLQRLRFAAAQSGASADLMDRALNVLNERLGAAAAGSEDAQKAFAALGLHWQTLQRMGTEEAFLAIADAIAQIPDVTERARLQADLFGERSRALANTIGMGRDGLIEFGKEAARVGVVLDEKAVTSLASANDLLDKFATQMSVSAARAVVRLVPLITDLAESIDRVVIALNSSTVEWTNLTNTENLIVRFVRDVAASFDFLIERIRATMQEFQAIAGFIGRLTLSVPDTAAQEVSRLQGALELLQRQPATDPGRIAKEADIRARLAAAEARLAAGDVYGLGGPPSGRPRPAEPAPSRRLPPIDLAGQKRLADLGAQLTEEAQRASGHFSSWHAAIQAIERDVRMLDPLLENLREQAQKGSVTFDSWAAAAQGIEQEIRSAVETTGDWQAAIARANSSLEDLRRERMGDLLSLGEALEEEFQTPLERLEALKERFLELQELTNDFDPAITRAMRAAQIEFARTTLVGQGLEVVAEGITDAFDQTFEGIIQGTLNVKEAFANMARSILLSISRLLIQRGITTLLNIALGGLGGAPTSGLATFGGTTAMQHGGYIPGARGARTDSTLMRATPGEFVIQRQAADVLGPEALRRLNSIHTFQQVQSGLPLPTGVAARGSMPAPQLHVHNIVVANDQQAQAKRGELEAMEGHIVNVINRQLLAGDGSLINRSIRMVHSGR